LTHDQAGKFGLAMEETMITMIFEPSTPTVKVAARFAVFSLSTAATTKPELSASDREERRWQLEWQRRNVEVGVGKTPRGRALSARPTHRDLATTFWKPRADAGDGWQ
jgi:hypothetical protein